MYETLKELYREFYRPGDGVCRTGQLCLWSPNGTWLDNRITALRRRTVRGSSDRSLCNGGENKMKAMTKFGGKATKFVRLVYS